MEPKRMYIIAALAVFGLLVLIGGSFLSFMGGFVNQYVRFESGYREDSVSMQLLNEYHQIKTECKNISQIKFGRSSTYSKTDFPVEVNFGNRDVLRMSLDCETLDSMYFSACLEGLARLNGENLKTEYILEFLDEQELSEKELLQCVLRELVMYPELLAVLFKKDRNPSHLAE